MLECSIDLKSIRQKNALTRRQIGKLLGLNEQTILRIELGEQPLPKKSLRTLQRMLSPDTGQRTADNSGAQYPAALQKPLSPHPATGKRSKGYDLPVLGFAQGGKDGIDARDGTPLEWVRRPSCLEDVKDAFAVFVTGNSMVPHYHAGDLVYINPAISPRSGQYVLVETTDHKGFIKQFINWSRGLLRLRQFNPHTDLWLREESVLRVMSVVHRFSE